MFYEVTVIRSDTDGDQWIANDSRILRRLRDVAYREGWWLHSFERSGSVASMRYVATDGATLEQHVRFVMVPGTYVRRRSRPG